MANCPIKVQKLKQFAIIVNEFKVQKAGMRIKNKTIFLIIA